MVQGPKADCQAETYRRMRKVCIKNAQEYLLSCGSDIWELAGSDVNALCDTAGLQVSVVRTLSSHKLAVAALPC